MTGQEFLAVPLPEGLLALKAAGRFDAARAGVEEWLGRELPQALRTRLEMERGILETLAHSTGPEPAPAEDSEVEVKRRRQLKENVALMKRDGRRSARLHIRASLQIKKEFERPGVRMRVYLPIPQAARQVSDIRIIRTEGALLSIAPEDAPQRTVAFETEMRPGEVFAVEYAWTNRVEYVDLWGPAAAPHAPFPDSAAGLAAGDALAEELPHIRFTPYLRELLGEITRGCGSGDKLALARAIYTFITTRVAYTRVREYKTFDCIAEYTAANLCGDCGFQAILFITLCRMAGIRARWQSGLSAGEYQCGCHDWAEFYLDEWGWLFADPSFGGGALKQGDLERSRYYFGNLDVYRLPANSAICAPFNPRETQERTDPVDNQTGEAEYADRPIPAYALTTSQTLVSLEYLDAGAPSAAP